MLIAYDGSNPAQAAIRGLTRASLPRRIEATVLSVADVPMEVRVANYPSGVDDAAALPSVVDRTVIRSCARRWITGARSPML
jgi:hypothetical protein